MPWGCDDLDIERHSISLLNKCQTQFLLSALNLPTYIEIWQACFRMNIASPNDIAGQHNPDKPSMMPLADASKAYIDGDITLKEFQVIMDESVLDYDSWAIRLVQSRRLSKQVKRRARRGIVSFLLGMGGK